MLKKELKKGDSVKIKYMGTWIEATVEENKDIIEQFFISDSEGIIPMDLVDDCIKLKES